MLKKIIKFLKWTGVLILLSLSALIILYWDLVSYGVRQAKGQLTIVWNAMPIDHYLNDPAFPDSLKMKLKLVAEVRQYAIDSLGLKDTKNYRTLYDQQGQQIMWVVTASEPFRLKEKEWTFPVLGAVPYKGFFDRALAMEEEQKLKQEGWDVSVRSPGGWSTLGWFTDPILSEMLFRSEGDLASLIIHEMVHATIFVKDSVDFNENLASFIGDRGAEKFLISKYGLESTEHTMYLQEEKDFLKYTNHILRGCGHLDSLYTAIALWPEDEKIIRKEKSIRKIIEALDTLSLIALPNATQRNLQTLPNNAYFMSFLRYQSKQDDLWNEWQSDFKGNLRAYIQWLRQRYPYL